jgi:hypothetical protein
MKKFEIEFTGRIKIKARDFDHAKAKFVHRYPENFPTEVVDLENDEYKPVVGRCEITDLPVYEDDDYVQDSEGCIMLKEYYDQFIQESEGNFTQNSSGHTGNY